MSSFLRPVALESCQSGLRERRRSSVNAITAVPRLFTSALSSADQGSAIIDDEDHSLKHASPTEVQIPHLSSLKLAQLPDHASKITIPRHFKKPPMIDTTVYEVSSPTSSSPPTAMECDRKEYFPDVKEDSKPDPANMERIRWRLASGFFAYFMCGWGDGVTGTVLPHFMADFKISLTLSSTLYAGSTVGFMFGTILIEILINFLGRFDLSKTHWSWLPETSLFNASSRKSLKRIGYSPTQARLLALIIASVLHGSFFVLMGSRSGFGVMFFAYAVAAFARAILTGTLNAYFVSGYQQSVGYAFGLWSFGGVISPMVCQALMAMGVPYYQFYFGSLVLSCFNAAFLIATYMPTPREFAKDCEAAISAAAKAKVGSSPTSTSTTPTIDYPPKLPVKKEARKDSKTLRLVLSMPSHWALSFFAMLYCGCETVTQAFMVSYLLGVRNANAKTAGYVTSGFWGGITIARLIWGHYTPKLTYNQRKWVVEACILLGLTMQITIWTVNSHVQNSFAASIIGLLYGPVYPAILTLTTNILPAEVHMASMAVTSALASLGAALFPFIAGLISSAHGIHTISYVTVSLASTIAIFWAAFPSKIPARPN